MGEALGIEGAVHTGPDFTVFKPVLKLEISGGQPGPVTMQLRQALLDVQTGAAPDPHNWMHTIC